MLQRIKRAYKAFVEPQDLVLDLSKLTDSELDALQQGGTISVPRSHFVPLGDGKAEFLPDMTEEEYLDHVKDESGYWKKFKGRLGL